MTTHNPASLYAVLFSESRRQKTPLYLVGGPVRDKLLGRPYHDFDLVCRHARAVAQKVGRRLQARFIVLDEQNLIYRLVLPQGTGQNVTLDFAELQGKRIENDLGRRDFTINAMARLVESESIIDPFGGQRDLKRRTIRAVSRKAFPDDPLRLLRAFRFAVQLGFKIDGRTLGWIRHDARLLRPGIVARERVREELLRLLAQPSAGKGIRALREAGLLTILFPDLEACRRVALAYYGKGGVLKHSVETVEQLDWILAELARDKGRPHYFTAPEVCRGIHSYVMEAEGGFPRAAWMKLAGLLHDIGKPATAQRIGGRLRFFGHEDVGADLARRVGTDLRLSRRETQVVSQWVRHHMRLGNLAAARTLTDKAIARYFRNQGSEGVGMVLVSLADHYSYLPRRSWGKGRDPVERAAARMLESYYIRRERVAPPKLVDGHQLMKTLRLKPGPLIGRLLEALADEQAGGKIKTVPEALRFARTVYPRLRSKAT